MKVLVTGATGFAGGAAARRFLARGDEVRVLVRDRARAAELEKAGAKVHTGSIADPNEVLRAAQGAEVVVHAASVRSHKAALRALEWVNIAGTENVIAAAKRAKCARVIHVSCADVAICNEDRVHWNEDRGPPGPPLDAHARTKLLAEELALSATGPGFAVAALRPAWLWGPRDGSMLAELCVEAQREGALRLVGDGSNLIATLYIDNFADGVVAAATADGVGGRPFALADADFIDAAEFLRMTSEAVGLPPPRSGPPYAVAYALAWARERMGGEGWWRTDVVRRGRSTQLDVQRAVNELGWSAKVTVPDGMKHLAAWAKEAGGAAAIAKLARPPATADSVAAQVAAAGD